MRNHGDEEHRKGVSRAATISLRQIQEKLDSLKEQMKVPGLTKAEQLVYNQLDELMSDIEVGFDHYWRGLGRQAVRKVSSKHREWSRAGRPGPQT